MATVAEKTALAAGGAVLRAMKANAVNAAAVSSFRGENLNVLIINMYHLNNIFNKYIFLRGAVNSNIKKKLFTYIS
ncbi:hypothetical protein IMSAG049_01678 [Clostridiales bacterium]|nr:hypothetical protein IMSAG049_01678 [Clostridiales bacterium]